ncbi:uncharacterized protein BT62DRAFT_310161 [Guyanagaster necrorhizus]|uniref:F-box domain-containing protein n=1 Tax=Guyanagaster necrorhizus TaxID=856835 RepID=A0A9P7VPD0_9AGAR|nr:uncharacterized protein BT62DRAFT_310161 [Guyanagaster necrorhizus MCA 3950]KAG7444030.1 hypothetical protein BT62DRAFT_310161 [Guyanagaster necrorhizus MCA 3950]
MHLLEDESRIRKSLTTYRPSWPQLTCFDVLAASIIFLCSDQSIARPKAYKFINEGGDTDIIQDPFFQVMRLYGFLYSWEGFVEGNLDLSGRHRSRYAFLDPLVHAFAKEITAIQALTVQVVDNETGLTKVSLSDEAAWETFSAKWLIPKGLNFSIIYRVACPLLDDNGLPAEPKFQQLCFLDLPNELLDLCFCESDLPDARTLSATCKHLKAVALPYIYVSRLLSVLPATLNFQDAQLTSSSIQPKDLLSLQHAHRQSVATLNFLLSRPDITDRLRRVRLLDHWCQDQHEYTPMYIHSMICDVLYRSKNLTIIKNKGFSINEQFVAAIAASPSLHTIFLHGCAFFFSMDLFLSKPDLLPQLRSVRHLTFLIDYHLQFRAGILRFTYFCQNLVELTILLERGHEAIRLPSRFSDFARLRCLQYLCIDSLHSDSLDGFKEWLVVLGSSTTSHPHPLSHVKVGLAYPESDIGILQLVDVLDKYSIRSLYLDGLLEGHPELISGIAERLPGLEALTLLRRAGRRERWLCSWPKPVWVYASHFTNFTNLRSFGWNMPMVFDQVTPKALVLFEGEGAEHEDSVLPYAGLSPLEQDDELSEDDERHRMAVVFSAFITTLETISFCTAVGGINWRIKREDGRTHIEYAGRGIPERPCWNPTWSTSLESSVMI